MNIFHQRLPWTASAIDSILLDVIMIIISGAIYFSARALKSKGAKSFGAGNFKALFESIERDQAMRGNL